MAGKKYYLIQVRNVRIHSPKYPLDTTFQISTTPGYTNMSGEARADGWLGTTNDSARYAWGAFDSFAEAVAAIPDEFAKDRLREDDPEAYGMWTVTSKKAVEIERRRMAANERQFLKDMEKLRRGRK